MLLSSSQVSTLLSFGIVLLFTTALFLSGVAVQHRTLRTLRHAIKPEPRPSPKIYLPDRFREDTTELSDGTIVVLDQYDRPKKIQTSPDGMAVEVKETLPEPISSQQKGVTEEDRPTVLEEEEESKSHRVQEKDAPAPWKEKSKAPTQEFVEDPDDETKLLSRAERRRLIKEEIKRLSQGETPVYYQRRLW